MRTLFFILLAVSMRAQIVSVNITNLWGTTTLTCLNPAITLSASGAFSGAAPNYTWIGPGGLVNGATINITAPGVYTVAGSNGTQIGGATLAITANTTAPTFTIFPTSPVLSCSLTPAALFTVNSTSPNSPVATYTVWAPSAITPGQFIGPNLNFIAYEVGIHTVIAQGSNGCTSQQTFAVVSNSLHPTFSITASPTVLGCGSFSASILNMINAQSNPPGMPIAGGWLTPGSSSVIIPGNALSYTATVPGPYTAVIKDASSGCETRVIFHLIQNITPPTLSVSATLPHITCTNPGNTLTASSSNTNVTFNWGASTTNVSTFVVNANVAAPSNSIALVTTLTAISQLNGCKSSTIISVLQNLFKPSGTITASSNTLSCNFPTVVLTGNGQSTFPMNTFTTGGIIITQWDAPSAQPPLALSSTYTAQVAGVYTMSIKDVANGCTNTVTTALFDNRIYPYVELTSPCLVSGSSVAISASTSSLTGYSYTWTSPNGGGTVTETTGIFNVNAAGVYTLATVQNTNPCITKQTILVQICDGIGGSENERENEKENERITVFPNPGAGSFTIRGSGEGRIIVIRDMTGKQVYAAINTGYETTLQFNASAGVYIVESTASGKVTARIRLVVQ